VDKSTLQPQAAIVAPTIARDDDTESAGVVTSELAVVWIFDIQSKRGLEGDVARLIEQKCGIKLPIANRCATDKSLAVSCVGPGHWLMVNHSGDRPGFKHQLEEWLADVASVFDQSAAFTIIRAEGPSVGDALAKGVHVDLNPGVFGAGSAAATTIAHIGVLLWKPDERPVFEFAVPRSLAIAFFEWLHEASLEFAA